jgi:hypothetical protein
VTPAPSNARTIAPAAQPASSEAAQELIEARARMLESQWAQADELLRDVVGAGKLIARHDV